MSIELMSLISITINSKEIQLLIMSNMILILLEFCSINLCTLNIPSFPMVEFIFQPHPITTKDWSQLLKFFWMKEDLYLIWRRKLKSIKMLWSKLNKIRKNSCLDLDLKRRRKSGKFKTQIRIPKDLKLCQKYQWLNKLVKKLSQNQMTKMAAVPI